LAGFFKALEKNLIKDGETVLINIGESANRAPLFLEQMIYTSQLVRKVEECEPHLIDDFRARLWSDVLND